MKKAVRASSPVPLEPFVHQVGGHFPMVCLDTDTVCKPLKDREHKFYISMSAQLADFVPGFEGTMKVETSEDEDGYITLRGQPPANYVRDRRSLDNSGSSKRHYRLKRRESLEIEPVDTREEEKLLSSMLGTSVGSNSNAHEVLMGSDDGESRKNSTDNLEEAMDNSNNDPPFFVNPWSLKCHRDHLRKLGLLRSVSSGGDGTGGSSANNGGTTEENNTKRSAKPRNPQTYLLLENLVSRYKYPCVLDLKVGSRQYADEVSAAKKQRKMAKAANTTLGTLGVRLCGMQVYNTHTSNYVCHNKYFGRSLTTATFQSAIEEFLSNGGSLRQDVLKQLIVKLEHLHKLLLTLDSYRFYTSSLLITYDGEQKPSSSDSSANSASSGDLNFSDNFQLSSTNPSASAVQDDIVDVRIIDFAHSTHKGFKDSVLHQGPDKGFIAGLTNFLAILRVISDPGVQLKLELSDPENFECDKPKN